MADMSVEEFEEKVSTVCSNSPAVRSFARYGAGVNWVNMRAYLTNNSMIDIFYNQRTGKTSFAQIRGNRRIFGADNRKGWHWRPREDPSQHIEAGREITFEEFLEEIEKAIQT